MPYGFAGSELLQALNTISAHQQAFRTLRDKMSELIRGGLALLGKPERQTFLEHLTYPFAGTQKSQSEFRRIRSLLIGCLPLKEVSL